MRLATPHPKPSKHSGASSKGRGLLLDHMLGVIDQLGLQHGIRLGNVSLDRMEKDCPWTKDIVAKLILRTIKVQSEGIWAAQHPLLSSLDLEVSLPESLIPRYRIPDEAVDHNLRCLLGAALQTLTLLPPKDLVS